MRKRFETEGLGIRETSEGQVSGMVRGGLQFMRPQCRKCPRVVHLSDAAIEPAMTWDEIGAAMGITKQHAFMIYARAMEKLRREFRRSPELYLRLMDELNGRDGCEMVYPKW
jgi:hypothetical protein